jgi:hypothetical protein
MHNLLKGEYHEKIEMEDYILAWEAQTTNLNV